MRSRKSTFSSPPLIPRHTLGCQASDVSPPCCLVGGGPHQEAVSIPSLNRIKVHGRFVLGHLFRRVRVVRGGPHVSFMRRRGTDDSKRERQAQSRPPPHTIPFLWEKEHRWDRVRQDKSGGSESKSYSDERCWILKVAGCLSPGKVYIFCRLRITIGLDYIMHCERAE